MNYEYREQNLDGSFYWISESAIIDYGTEKKIDVTHILETFREVIEHFTVGAGVPFARGRIRLIVDPSNESDQP